MDAYILSSLQNLLTLMIDEYAREMRIERAEARERLIGEYAEADNIAGNACRKLCGAIAYWRAYNKEVMERPNQSFGLSLVSEAQAYKPYGFYEMNGFG